MTKSEPVTLLLGDCIEQMRTLPDNSVDACVTDPPYGLSFMGKRWDYDVPSVDVWREVYRVMKPGAHLLSFGGTRTYHRMVCAIEDAGFEIRDQVMWIYGSGFPKSLDVSKAIDKAAGAEREVVGRAKRTGKEKGTYGAMAGDNILTAPATPDAKEWQGWGTALKPANEPIVLARKPLEKGLTVAQNVLRYGTGAINVDASRIGDGKDRTPGGLNSKTFDTDTGTLNFRVEQFLRPTGGRWPANVLFDECAAAHLDESVGELKSGGNSNRKSGFKKEYVGGELERPVTTHLEREKGGGPSRYFYVAKASRRERNAGLEGMPERVSSKVGQTVWTNQCVECGRSRPQTEKACGSCGGGLEKIDRQKPASINHHPTVKPVRLMEYLVRMITPPGGVCLDPFLGSGTTLVACARLGVRGIGCEMSAEYLEIARRRIEHAKAQNSEGDDAA